jgi:hypothetical protein
MPDLVTAILIHLAVGAVLWAFNDPFVFIDFTIRSHVQRTGRMPSGIIIVRAILVEICLWPKLVLVVVKAMRSSSR